MDTSMTGSPWHYVLQFLSGALLTNGVPHFVWGLAGTPFQSPFAKPPGVGESSPRVNVWWGWANLVGGAVLFAKFGPSDYAGWGVFAAASLLMGTFCATHFGKVRAKPDVHSSIDG
jgi:hypothetical protein